MDNFQDSNQIPNLNQNQINHLNSPIAPKETEAVIKSLPTKKSPGSDEFSAEFYQTFKENLVPILFKLFHKIETKEYYPIHSMKPQLQLIPNLHNPNKERELQSNFPYKY